MPGLTLAEVPADVAEVVQEVSRFLGIAPSELFVADHTHEELSEGAHSIAYEGDYEWPFRFCEAVHAGYYSAPGALFLASGTGWYLAVYPDTE